MFSLGQVAIFMALVAVSLGGLALLSGYPKVTTKKMQYACLMTSALYLLPTVWITLHTGENQDWAWLPAGAGVTLLLTGWWISDKLQERSESAS